MQVQEVQAPDRRGRQLRHVVANDQPRSGDSMRARRASPRGRFGSPSMPSLTMDPQHATEVRFTDHIDPFVGQHRYDAPPERTSRSDLRCHSSREVIRARGPANSPRVNLPKSKKRCDLRKRHLLASEGILRILYSLTILQGCFGRRTRVLRLRQRCHCDRARLPQVRGERLTATWWLSCVSSCPKY